MSAYRSEAALIGALILTLRPPNDELSFLSPMRIADVCALVECEPHHLAGAMVRRWIECSAEYAYGVRVAASDVFGEAAREGAWREGREAA